MIFRQLFDQASSTYSYLLACEITKQAVVIDPVYEQARRDLALLKELGLVLHSVLDTHCHADHVTAAWLLQQRTGCRIASAKAIGADHADNSLMDGDVIEFGQESLCVMATPGHTDGCLTYVTADKTMAFTGDALLIRGCGRCDFQQGDAATLFHSITQKIFQLPDHCRIFPGHDYNGRLMSTVIEEKQFNTRVGGQASELDFVGFMSNMRLPHPKLMEHAVPANLKSGRPDNGLVKDEPAWAPIYYTFSGVPEVEAQWVLDHRADVHILDVRESEELDSPVDRLPNTLVIPLGQLRGSIESVPVDKPVVCLCRSGRRSAMAVNILQNAGFDSVANIAGGMLRWKDLA